MDKKILILLSTYNGGRYLREQLDSLLRQKGVKITILVRDDGSKDDTIKILEDYERMTHKVIIIKGVNCGSCNSFFKLMEEGHKLRHNYDYFAFCDQDDVWLEDKLEVAIKALENNATHARPSLYMSAYQMVDLNLAPIITPQIKPTISLPAAIASNCATGCTMVFNSTLLSASLGCNVKNVIMHDYWVYLICLAYGGIALYDTTPHILYRQHANNVIGGKGDNFLKKWCVRFKKIFKKGDYFKSRLAEELLFACESQINKECRLFLYSLITQHKLSSKLYIMRCKDFWTASLDCNIKNLGLLFSGKI